MKAAPMIPFEAWAIMKAIKKNSDAPIFQVADFGLAADYKSTVPELIGAHGRALLEVVS